ncbi:MAG TPA: hypothetical protein VG452_10850 [Egibacteraceae bacterium]|nr:hypothetical protein [Egibacteraceae bacterium]
MQQHGHELDVREEHVEQLRDHRAKNGEYDAAAGHGHHGGGHGDHAAMFRDRGTVVFGYGGWPFLSWPGRCTEARDRPA